MCGSIISLLQRRLSELFRRLQKLILQIRDTYFLQYSKWELQPRYAAHSAPFALKDLLIPAGNKLSLAERNPKRFFLWPGIIPLAHPKRTASSSTPHASPSLQSRPSSSQPCANEKRKYPSYALEMPRGQLLSTTFFRGSRMLWANMGSFGKRIWVLGQVQSKLLSSSSVYSVL